MPSSHLRRSVLAIAAIVACLISSDIQQPASHHDGAKDVQSSAATDQGALVPSAPMAMATSGSAISSAAAATKTAFVPGQLLVQFKPGVSDALVKQVVKRTGASIVKEFTRPSGLALLALPEGMTVQRGRHLFASLPEVGLAEPNFIYMTSVDPDDPGFNRQWALRNIGQTGGVPGVDINASAAWEVTTGATATIVGVLDTGVDYNHSDIVGNLWVNPNEIAANDIDDDGNGWVDDVIGTNAARETSNPALGGSDVMDTNGHGTHVTGIIAASGNNGIGVTGVMWNAAIVTCKAFDGFGSGRLSAIIECLEYFAALKDFGVDIAATNNSWGGGSYSQLLYNAIEQHQQRDILFVAAAGNNGVDADIDRHYPATYDLDIILSVAAIDHTGAPATFSNFGATSIDIAAPGVDIFSTVPARWYGGFEYDYLSGTSMAAPHVTGVAGLLISKNPQLTAVELKNHILSTGIDEDGLQGITVSGKRLSAVIPMVDNDADGMDDDWESLNGLDPVDPSDASLDPDGDGLTNLEEFHAQSNPLAADSDSDGLGDADEVNVHGTNPALADSDGDQLTDPDEINVHGTNPGAADSDGDGLTDGEEVNSAGTDPLVADGDADGMADGWETQHQLDPFSNSDASVDADADGLSNLEEFQNNTNPALADTDSDGINDVDEITVTSTDPTVADTDNDRMPDGWEVGFGLNPLDPADASLDPDDDTWSSYAEFRVRTDPTDALSIPAIQPWSAFQGGPAHTGHVKVESDASDFSVRWMNEHVHFWTGDGVAVTDTQIFFSVMTGYLQVADASLSIADGELSWRSAYDHTMLAGAPATRDGWVYTVTTDFGVPSVLRSFNALTGVERYRRDLDFQLVSPIVTPQGDRLFVSAGRTVLGLDAATGAIVWQTDLPLGNSSYRALAVNDQYVIDFSDTSFYALDRNTGALLFEDTASNCYGSPANGVILADERYAYRYSEHCITKYDVVGQRMVWEIVNPVIVAGASVDEKTVFVSDSDGAIALDAESGELLWRWKSDDWVIFPPVSTLNHVFVSTESNTYALDRDSGEEVWSFAFGGRLSLTNEGALIIGPRENGVAAINIEGDRDADGLPNWYEKFYQFDWRNPVDAFMDADSDGLTNFGEFIEGTKAREPDSDGDGLSDADELNTHFTAALRADSDHDGLTDRDELLNHATDPNSIDTDGDTYTDEEEAIEFGTNAVDAFDSPSLLTNYAESFEQGIPAGWNINAGTGGGWTFDSSYASDGSISLKAQLAHYPDPAAVEWESTFDAGDLTFDARLPAQGSNGFPIRVYIDGVEVSRADKGGWAQYSISVPRGLHRVRWEFFSSGTSGSETAWIDNVRFAVPRQTAGDAKNFLVTYNNQLLEYKLDKEPVRAAIPFTDADHLDNLVVTPDHRVAIIDTPRLHIFDPVTSHRYSVDKRGWETGGNTGIVATDDSILALDGGGLKGILRFDLDGNFVDRLQIGMIYDDLAIGPDGLVYASILDGYEIMKLDPDTLEIVGRVELELGSTGLTFSVGSDGKIYVADVWCPGCVIPIIEYDGQGRLLNVVFPYDFLEGTDAPPIQDLNIHRFGKLLGGTFGDGILLADTGWDAFGFFELSSLSVQTPWPRVSIVAKDGVDADGDGMPDWWERVHSFDGSNSADASTDADSDGLNNLGEFEADTEPRVADTDADGLSDGEEALARLTNPLESDTDSDGVGDYDEVNVYGLDPLNTDTDGDDLSDGDELNVHGTDPLSADSDGDSLADSWEIENGLDPLVSADSAGDSDGDGLTNAEELQYGTDVNRADSDYDDLSDGEEVAGTLTNPAYEDSDGDRMWDGWEVMNAFDPLAPADAATDADADSFDNRTEFFAGTDARSSTSFPIMRAWTTHQGNATHSSFVPVELDPARFTHYWSIDVLDGNSTPVQQVASENGRAWITTNGYFRDSVLTAVDGITGGPMWHFDFSRDRATSPPALWDGRVYVQVSQPGELWRFDSQTGATATPGDFSEQFARYLAPTPFDGMIYAQSGTFGGVSAFSAADGSQLWNAFMPQYDGFTPAVDESYVYVHKAIDHLAFDIPARLDVLHRQSGNRALTIDDPDFPIFYLQFDSAPVLTPVRSVLTTYNGRLANFDVPRKKLAWQQFAAFERTPAFANGIIYVADAGELTAIDERSGQELWRWVGPGFISNDALVTLNHVFVSTRTDTYAVDVSTGQSTWSFPAGGALSLGHDRILYIATRDGDVHAIATFEDADLDGVADDWEQAYGLNSSTAADALGDIDADGLANLYEFRLQTSPTLHDTDSDGLTDGAEFLNYKSDPHYSDTDRDGLSDFAEINSYSTNPIEDDTDSDGLDDGDEISIHATNPRLIDSDTDGILDQWEVRLGSDPNVGTSRPVPVAVSIQSFESAVVPPRWDNGIQATTGWEVVAESGTDGVYQLRSKPVKNYEVAAIEWSDYFAGGEVIFDARVPLREFNENITFYVDGELRITTSNAIWVTFRTPLPAGTHTLRWEFHHDTRYVIDDLSGYIDYVRVVSVDADGDQMQDAWEVQYGLNPLDASDANRDLDGDGLSNIEEFDRGTIPNNPDTDSDTMPDGWEVQFNLNPLSATDGGLDSDGDTLSNANEYLRGTNPTSADSDNDGMPDGWEVRFGLNPLSQTDRNSDLDNDGSSNISEYNAGTDPTNPASRPSPPPPPAGGGGSGGGTTDTVLLLLAGFYALITYRRRRASSASVRQAARQLCLLQMRNN